MESLNLKRIRPFFTVLNLVIGWHLLYEGLVKILDPTWTSAGYLANAQGPLAGAFHRLVESPTLLQIIDVVNMAALTLIIVGGLVVGAFFM